MARMPRLVIAKQQGVRSFRAIFTMLKEIGEYFEKHYSTISRIVKENE